ncbi:MAG: hypothetical protein QF681_15540 [Vicinamibacterales bacterium]|nr:hypothetical protein [Vicinamibacterales bacterium]
MTATRAAAVALVPPTRLPLLYVAFAHVSLLAALAVVAVDPRGVSGFFYHPRMLAVVHLVTLGWISSSILGWIRVVGPLALRMAVPVTSGDYWAYACVVIGTSGMVSHFWLETFNGMAWSAAMTLFGLLHSVIRVIGRVRAVAIPRPIAIHLVLACVNFVLAGIVGVLIAIDKVTDVVPGDALSNVYAHLHLAAVGWASMMAVGVGYRLLPMVLPAAIPQGRALYASAVLLQTGLIGLVVTLATGWPGTLLFAICISAGVAAFLSRVVWMTTHRRTPPATRPQPDFGAAQAAHALLYLVLATICGLTLVASETSVWTPQLMMLYGVLGLLGFLGQLVVAMELRLLPLLAWYTAFARSGFTPPDLSVHVLPAQPIVAFAFGGWVLGLPVLASGLALERAPLVGVGAWVLLGAVTLNTVHAVWILRPLFGIAASRSQATE